MKYYRDFNTYEYVGDNGRRVPAEKVGDWMMQMDISHLPEAAQQRYWDSVIQTMLVER